MMFHTILPFLRPIEQYILDPDISEIMVTGNGPIFIERAGQLIPVDGVVITEEHLEVAVKNIARLLGNDISERQPLLESRLPDGSRVAAALKPTSISGTTLSIRKFSQRLLSPAELVRVGAFPASLADILAAAVTNHRNILISGGTSTGKTTVLNALATYIEPNERLVVIEDTSELQLPNRNIVRLEARRSQTGFPAVSIKDLVRHSLRHRPDRIIVGEVRGGEAFDLLQSLNTGHSGTLATIHASSAELALNRLTTCVLEANTQLPHAAIRSMIADSIHLVLHLIRENGRRSAASLLEVSGYDTSDDQFRFRELYRTAEPAH